MVWEGFLEEGASELGRKGRIRGCGHEGLGLWAAACPSLHCGLGSG